jgi:hypothetical protein
MKMCSWAAGCAQEISNDVDLCDYHAKVSGGLLRESGEVAKVASRKRLKRQGETAAEAEGARPDRPS